MSLTLHLSIHVFFAVLAGFIAWILVPSAPLIPFTAGLLGGVLIDLDHLIDYFIAYGYRFDLRTFIAGHHFLKNDKIYVLFHGWEYIILLGVVAWLFRENTNLQAAFLALTLGVMFHLIADLLINHGMTFRGYSALYRARHGYAMNKIVHPEHYEKDRARRQELLNEN